MKNFDFLKKTLRSVMCFVFMLSMCMTASAFVGSELEEGRSYYLYNVYQAKFLAAGDVLDNLNPELFATAGTKVIVGSETYTLSATANGLYQMKSGTRYYAYKENGAACELTYANTDRSHWMLISEDEYAAWRAKKKFTVASLNVDGMPKDIAGSISLNPDAKEGPGATAIGQKLLTSGFDVIGVSEDFNFHSELWNAAWNNGEGTHYNAMTHRGTIGVTASSLLGIMFQRSPLFNIDGLGLFYRIEGEQNVATPTNESWTAWKEHYGYTDNGADGLIAKGYRYYLITLADGTEIDLYTMHMDAETSPGDNAARASQLQQLVAAIKATDNKRPIIIIGDTNCRYTRDDLKGLLIDAINSDARFTIRDPWIQYGRNGVYPALGSSAIMADANGYLKGEVVDKIFYVNNTESNIRLLAETYCQDLSFVDEAGDPLCDHKPCVVTFSYHNYDPAIDDVEVEETAEEAVYLRNRLTGRFLADGGWWSTHAVVANYARMPMFINELPNGKYDICTKFGHITDAAYVDNNNPNEYIKEWNMIEKDGYYVLSYTQNGMQKALTANDPTFFNNDPLYRYVTTAALNANDEAQQWEIVTKAKLNEEIAAASATNPVNVTHLLPAANFDRNDWDDHAKWTLTKSGNAVTDNGINGIDNDPFCNFNRSITTTSTNQTWKLSQTLTGLPVGYYVVTLQGFVKDNYENVTFYAGQHDTDEWNGGPLADYESIELDRPAENDQTSAGRAFDKGLYQNVTPVIYVANGNLEIGVEKNNVRAASWTVVDNFQLYYLGTENPERDYPYDVMSTAVKDDGNGDGEDVEGGEGGDSGDIEGGEGEGGDTGDVEGGEGEGNDGEDVSVSGVKTDAKAKAKTYDLNGRKVEDGKVKGLVIKGGKKVLVK